MNKTQSEILLTFWAIFVKGKKHYICPAPNTIISLLERFHGTQIRRRWFFYCTAELRHRKLIKTKRRFTKGEDNLVRQIPSMIALTTKGVQYMQQRMTIGAKELYQRMIAWLNKDQQRFPRAADLFPDNDRMNPEAAILKVRMLIKDIG